MIKETEKISVLNYNENRVSIKVSPTESYSFEPSLDGVNPTTISMTIDQIRYANNHNVFCVKPIGILTEKPERK